LTRTGPGRAFGRQLPGLFQDRQQVIGVHDEIIVFGDRLGDAGDICFLEGIGTGGFAGNCASDGQDRYRVEHRVGQARDQIGRARA